MARDTAPVYKFQEMEFPIVIDIPQAFTLKADFDVNLFNMFEGNNLDNITIQLSLNDEKIIEIWWWFVSKKLADRGKAIDNLTRDSLTSFKECLWNAIVNFSDPAAREMLRELKKRLPELLKQQVSRAMDELAAESNQPKLNS